MTDPSSEDAAEFIRREYGKGGKGLVIGGKDYCVWFDEAGMKFAAGHSVDDPLMDKAYLSWDDVSGRIRQLLAQGEYAPQSVLDAARGNALREHATALVYMEHDLADGIADIVFEDTSIFEGGFPDAVTKVSEKLDDPAYLADLVERLESLAAAYAISLLQSGPHAFTVPPVLQRGSSLRYTRFISGSIRIRACNSCGSSPDLLRCGMHRFSRYGGIPRRPYL